MASGSRSARTRIARSSTTPRRFRRNEDAALSPTEFPFTQEDFDPQMEDALELMPEIVGDEKIGVKYAINGLISLTPDGMPLLGETPEVKGLWSACAVWVKEGPAVGKSIAEWMTHGQPEIDCNQSDISRFHAHQKTRQHTKARAFEAFPKTYGIVHPAEQYLSDRGLRKSPMYDWQEAHDAEFFEVAGWERPQWYRSNASPGGEVRRSRPAQRVGCPLVEPDHQRGAPRDARVGGPVRPVGVRDLRHRRARARSRRSSGSRCARWTLRWAGSSTRRSCRRPAASRAT